MVGLGAPFGAQARPLVTGAEQPRPPSWVSAIERFYGGGGNRTRVRGRTGQSVYKHRLPLKFALRPVGSRPTVGLVILWVSHLGR